MKKPLGSGLGYLDIERRYPGGGKESLGSKLSNTLYEVSNGGKRSEGKGRRKNDKDNWKTGMMEESKRAVSD